MFGVRGAHAIGRYPRVVDPYKILKVDPEATIAEVKRAFWRIAHAAHPDKTHHLDEASRQKLAEIFISAKNAIDAIFELRKSAKPVAAKREAARTTRTTRTTRTRPHPSPPGKRKKKIPKPYYRRKPKVTYETTSFHRGQRICHPTVGRGTVLWVQENDDDAKVAVQFDDGTKRILLARLANLTTD